MVAGEQAMHWIKAQYDKWSGVFWDAHPSVYVGLYFLHQLLISAVLLIALWILARHEGWRRGRRHEIAEYNHGRGFDNEARSQSARQ
jgi:hypothetical protein